MHMSTKIYTAFRLPGYTLERALHKLQAFQLEVLVPVAQQACHRKVVSEAVARLDAHHCGLDTEKPRLSPMAEAWSDLMGRANDIVKPGRRDPSVDFDFEVTLFPFDDAILGISFTEQFEDRVKAVTQARLLDIWDALQPELAEPSIGQAYRLLKTWRETPDGLAKKGELEAEVTSKLVKEVTLGLLLGRA
jgi:hypothetical protein